MVYILDSAITSAVAAALPFFPYTCDVKAPTVGSKDSVGGSPAPTYSTVTGGSGLKLLYELLRNPSTVTLANKKQVTLTHRVYVEAVAASLAITPEYQILVNATDTESEITFKNPIKAEGAFSHLVTLHCSIGSLV